MSRSLPVAHVVLSLDVGGLERVVLDLVRHGRDLGQEPCIICLERPGTLAAQAEALGAQVFCVEKRPGIRPVVVCRLKKLFRRLRPQVVHSHQIGALFYAAPAARAAGVPVVVHTEHGKHYAHSRRARWLGWLAARSAQRFFCVSADIAAEVTRLQVVPASKVQVVPNGIDTLRFAATTARESVRAALGLAPDALVIGTIGRLNEIKRQDVLLAAFARLHQQLPAARLLLVGDGPLRDALHAQAENLGIRAAVVFAGYQAEPERYLQAMDVFALTSRSEGMPLVILEAWAAGLPVVASRVGGLPELIDPGRTGLLVPFGDVEILAQTLAQLLVNRTLATDLGHQARQLVQAWYDVRVMARAYQRQYADLLARRGRTAACAS